jgi:tol-pal system protein YbgF
MNRPPYRRSRWHACLSLALAVGVVASLGGCASGSRAQQESEIATLHRQIDELRRSQEASTREMARLAGEVKAVDAQSAFLAGEATTTRDELARVKTALEEGNQAVLGLRSSIEDMRKLAAAPAAAPPTPLPTSASSPETMYAEAMASFQAAEHGQAILQWVDLMKRFPEHPLASNAQYWIAEAYYRQGDVQQALLEFRKVIDGFPKSPQVPEALLKVGLCHRALKDATRARAAWERLAAEYPATSAAAQARALLAAVGAAGRPHP